MNVRCFLLLACCTALYGCPNETPEDKYAADLGTMDISGDTSPDMSRDESVDLTVDKDPDVSPLDMPDMPDMSDMTDSSGDMDMGPMCGDGVKNDGEACDDGPGNSDTVADACRTSCKTASCGDGVQDTGEQCDDGAENAQSADKCRLDCKTPFCGDGVQDSNEVCDDGNMIDDDNCTTACTLCGNGRVDAGETCDQGQVVGVEGDGCGLTCQVEPLFACDNASPSNCWRQWHATPPKAGHTGFGSTIVTTTDTVFVGVPGDDTSAVDAGAVHVYTKGALGWRFGQTLYPPTGESGAKFGTSLYVSNDILFVGAPESSGPRGQSRAGAFYTFSLANGQWGSRVKTQAPTPTANAYFGFQVTDTVISAPGHGGVGALYFFGNRTPPYRMSAPYSPPVLNPGAQFGAHVSVLNTGSSTTTAFVVNAPGYDSTPNDFSVEGALFGVARMSLGAPTISAPQKGIYLEVLEHNNAIYASNGQIIQVFDDRLRPTDQISPPVGAVPKDQFGVHMAAVNNKLLIGSPKEQVIYQTNTMAPFTYSLPYTQPTTQGSSGFGEAFTIEGSTVFVGAPSFDINGIDDLGALFPFALK